MFPCAFLLLGAAILFSNAFGSFCKHVELSTVTVNAVMRFALAPHDNPFRVRRGRLAKVKLVAKLCQMRIAKEVEIRNPTIEKSVLGKHRVVVTEEHRSGRDSCLFNRHVRSKLRHVWFSTYLEIRSGWGQISHVSRPITNYANRWSRSGVLPSAPNLKKRSINAPGIFDNRGLEHHKSSLVDFKRLLVDEISSSGFKSLPRRNQNGSRDQDSAYNLQPKLPILASFLLLLASGCIAFGSYGIRFGTSRWYHVVLFFSGVAILLIPLIPLFLLSYML